MKIYKALVLTTWFYSLLLWLYIVLRITINRVNIFDRFIYSIPYLTFFSLGVISFIVSFVSLFVYVAIWGIPGDAQAK